MAQRSKPATDSRRHPRINLPAMYTLVRVRPPDRTRFCWTGHIYDISASGIRFELDFPLDPGTEVELRATLPGEHHTTVSCSGHVVRHHDPTDERGPFRMGLNFDHFKRPIDRRRLTQYLSSLSKDQAA